MEAKEGYCIIIPTMFGGPSLWTEQEGDGPIMPCIWETIEDAQRELIKEYIDHLQSFVDGDREWEETDTEGPGEQIALIDIDAEGNLTVSDEDGIPLIEKTLEGWRKTL